MIKSLYTMAILICIAFSSFAQSNSTLANLKFNDAEEAFINGDYTTVLTKLDETEKLSGTTNDKIHYLRILSLVKVLESKPGDKQLLEKLQASSSYYLKNYENKAGLEKKYAEVYSISESVNAQFEKAKQLELDKLEQERNALALKEAQELKRKEDQEKIAKEAEAKRIRKLSNVGFFAIRGGLAIPMNGASKDLVSYNDWLNDDSYVTPFKEGQFGLKEGFRIGFTGIIPLGFINKSINPHFGFGLSIDFNQTFMTYSWKDLATKAVTSDYFENATYSPFSISSVGMGPSFTVRPFNKKIFVDIYARPDLNVMTGGAFYGSYTLNGDNYDTYDNEDRTVSAGTESVQVKIGPTIGLNIRLSHLFLGVDARFGLNYDAPYNERITQSYYENDPYYDYQYNYYTGYYDYVLVDDYQYVDDSYYNTAKTPGLILNYIGFSTGLKF